MQNNTEIVGLNYIDGFSDKLSTYANLNQKFFLLFNRFNIFFICICINMKGLSDTFIV